MAIDRPDRRVARVQDLASLPAVPIAGFFLVVGAIALGASVLVASEELAYDRDGVVATGTVLELRRVAGGIDEQDGFEIVYRFEAQPGQGVEGRDRVPEEVWYSAAVGDEIAVLHLRADPERNRVHPLEASPLLPAVFAVGGLVLTVLGVAAALSSARAARRRRLRGAPGDAPTG